MNAVDKVEVISNIKLFIYLFYIIVKNPSNRIKGFIVYLNSAKPPTVFHNFLWLIVYYFFCTVRFYIHYTIKYKV